MEQDQQDDHLDAKHERHQKRLLKAYPRKNAGWNPSWKDETKVTVGAAKLQNMSERLCGCRSKDLRSGATSRAPMRWTWRNYQVSDMRGCTLFVVILPCADAPCGTIPCEELEEAHRSKYEIKTRRETIV